MRRIAMRSICLGSICLAAAGCANSTVARYIYQDGEFGVVAIPVNTDQGRLNFRAQAEALMASHFPDGFEIVRAEEVNEGERLLNLARRTEIASDPQLGALNQVIKFGKLDRTTSYEEKDKLQVRECRIIYKRGSPRGPDGAGRFTAVASLTPPLYIDPNEILRQQAGIAMLAKATAPAKKVEDHETRKASGESTPAAPSQPVPAKSVLH